MMGLNNIRVIVTGGLNTDLIFLGVKRFVKPGESVGGAEFSIGPGGKSRNIAQMIGILLGRDRVAMIGRTVRDPFNLWKPPVTALKKSGVNTRFVEISNFKKVKMYPSMAAILIDRTGKNQIYVAPEIGKQFSKKDIENAEKLFNVAGKNEGFLVSALEMPISAMLFAVRKAHKAGLKFVLDPGGIGENDDIKDVLRQNIFLIKPNEHEARMLTDIKVIDFASARKAARVLQHHGAQNVLITHGVKGAYLFTEKDSYYVRIPKIKGLKVIDTTGCGDQVMATLCAELVKGTDIVSAAKMGVLAGTLQCAKVGIQAVTRKELEQNKKHL